MKPYLDLLKNVLENGTLTKNRTGIDTITLFGTQTKYDIRDSFPLLTSKKMYWKGIVYELLWFIKGDTNIKYLVDHNVHIWDEWAYEKYKKEQEKDKEEVLSQTDFIKKIKEDENFANQWGDLGNIYGKQWRNFDGIDQLKNAIDEIKNNPNSRRIIVSAWNPKEIKTMALPPCHTLFQFYVENGTLSLQLYQRSADMFLGVPFNIASYSLLVYLVAYLCGLKPGYFIHSIGVVHIYTNHLKQVKEQLTRKTYKLPSVIINPNKKYEKIEDFTFEDIILKNYESEGPLRGEVAV